MVIIHYRLLEPSFTIISQLQWDMGVGSERTTDFPQLVHVEVIVQVIETFNALMRLRLRELGLEPGRDEEGLNVLVYVLSIYYCYDY